MFSVIYFEAVFHKDPFFLLIGNKKKLIKHPTRHGFTQPHYGMQVEYSIKMDRKPCYRRFIYLFIYFFSPLMCLTCGISFMSNELPDPTLCILGLGPAQAGHRFVPCWGCNYLSSFYCPSVTLFYLFKKLHIFGIISLIWFLFCVQFSFL